MSRASSEKAELLMTRLGLKFNHILGIRFAINVAISTWIVWAILNQMGSSNHVWAIVSTVACADPQPKRAGRLFVGRLVNAIVGCCIGLLFLQIGGSKGWTIPLAMATTVLVTSLFIRIKEWWLQAPITTALVIASALSDPTDITGMNIGFRRMEEVLLGSCIGVTISLIMAKVWFIQNPPEKTEPIAPMEG